MAAMSLIHYLILLAIVLFVVRFVLKPLFSPQAREVGRIFLLLPLMVVGALFLAFVVLKGVRTFSESHDSAIRVVDGDATAVRISSNGIVIKSTPSAATVAVPAPPSPTPAPTPSPAPAAAATVPSQSQPGTAPANPSGIARTIAAMQKALVTAMHSMPRQGDPAAPAAPVPAKEPSPAARTASASRPVAPANAGPSAVKPAVAEAPATASAVRPAVSKRPAWIDTPPQPSAGLYEIAVMAGPFKTPLECERPLDEEIEWAVDDYVAWRIGEEARSQTTIPSDYARQHLVKEQWLERVNTSLGEMYNLHALLSFDRQVEGKLLDAWRETLLSARVILSAAILGGILLLLSVIYGYLKIDLATAGAYRGRLRFVAAAMVLTLAVAGAALWQITGAARSV